MRHDVGMPNYPRLADAIQARARELGLTQEQLVTRSGMGRTTIQRLWKGTADNEPAKRTKNDLEQVLGWVTGSVDAVLADGDPTVRRETSDESSGNPLEAVAAAIATAGADLPLAVKLAIETGKLLDYDVQYVTIDGEELAVITLAKTGTYDTEEKRAAIRGQLELFGRIKDHIRTETEGADDTTPTSE